MWHGTIPQSAACKRSGLVIASLGIHRHVSLTLPHAYDWSCGTSILRISNEFSLGNFSSKVRPPRVGMSVKKYMYLLIYYIILYYLAKIGKSHLLY